jgi:hypothetical protein
MHFNLWEQVAGDFLIIATYGAVPLLWGLVGYSVKDNAESPLVFLLAIVATVVSHLITAGVIK